MTVSLFRTSHRLVQEQMDQLTAHLLTAHEDRDLDEEELLLLLISHAEWKTLQLVSLPQFQFALISWMKRPVFDVFDCSFIPDCSLLQFSLFLCCLIRRSPADFLERPAKRSGCTVTNSRATSSRAGCPRRKTPTPFALACRKRSRISLSLQVEPQLLPFSSHVAEQTGNKNKNEPKNSFFGFSQSIYHCTRL